MSQEENSWRTPNFRQSVVNKINEAIVQSGMTSSKNSMDMENHVYHKSRNKDEYLSYVARLILHVRDINKSKTTANPQQQPQQSVQQDPNSQQNVGPGQPQQQQQPAPGNMQQGNQMPDPINALQNLASAGTRGPQQGVPSQQNMMQGQQQGPSNLLQTLTQHRPLQGMNPMQNVPQRPGVPAQMSGGNMSMGMGNQNPQMGGPQMMQNQNQLMQNQQMMQQNQMMNQAPMNAMTNQQVQLQMQQGGQVPAQMMNMNQQMNQMPMGGMNQQMGIRPQGMGPGPMMNQPNQMPMGNANINAAPMNPMMLNPNMTRTPGGAVHSPMSQPGMIPSPALVPSPNPQMGGPGMINRPPMMAPSPSGPLNTPLRPGETAAQSPLNAHDEQLYREKYRQLTKYIEPLKRMIARMGNDDGDRLLKLKKLLELLSNPNSRIPLDTLLKCETALENQLGTFKEHTNNPLLEAVSANLQSPLSNHTLQRTFRPCLDTLFGSDIKPIPLPSREKRFKKDDGTASTGPEMSHILQGEVARLDQKFKITLDSSAQAGSKTVKLICWLDDKHLPCIPPISVTIPKDYPNSSPECFIEQEYEGSEFLRTVQKAFIARMAKLSKQFSLSHLLDTWEMALRQACAPKLIKPHAITVMMNV